MSANYIQELRETVIQTTDKLLSLTEPIVSKRPKPDKWSPKEILGHLIDSACNNHRRFVNAQLQSNMVFDGYAQAQWVEIQHYRDASWEELVYFWKFYNLHLANLMEVIPEKVRNHAYNEHNLHKIAMRTIPENQATNLDYLMNDYVFHLKHHLKQIKEIIQFVQ